MAAASNKRAIGFIEVARWVGIMGLVAAPNSWRNESRRIED